MSKILKGLNESTHNKYDNNRTGFSRGPRDDERHDLDAQKPAREEWALKINGKVWSKDGKTVTFTSKEKALKARQSLLAKRPELEVGLVSRKVSEGFLDAVKDKYNQAKDYFDDSPEAVERKLARLRNTGAEARPGANTAQPVQHQTQADPYQVLGVSPDANSADIKLAYRRLAKKHHPDFGGDAAEFQKITDAFNELIASGAVIREEQLSDDTQTRMRMNDYYDLADAIQEKLRQAIQLGNKELIQKYSKERDDLDARVKQHGLMHESEQLDELSNDKLGQYKTAAAADAGKADKQGDYKRGDKRMSGIIKATKKQFDNDEKKSNMDEADDNSLDPFKHVNPRVSNPKILGTQNRAKSAYYPPTKPPVKKLDKPLPENVNVNIPSKSFEELVKAKLAIERQREADIEAWKQDFQKNTAQKAQQQLARTFQPIPVAQSGEKYSVLKDRLKQLNIAEPMLKKISNLITHVKREYPLVAEKMDNIDKQLLQQIKDGAADNYQSLMNSLKQLDTDLPKIYPRAYNKLTKLKQNNPSPTPSAYSQQKGGIIYTDTDGNTINEFASPEKDQLDELSCWSGYHRVAGTKAGFPGSCAKNKTNEEDVAEGASGIEQKIIKLYKQGLSDDEIASSLKIDSDDVKRVLDDYEWVADTTGEGEDVAESHHSESCPHCGGEMVSEELMNEKKDACYYKVKSRYKVWPSAYASGALVKCRNKGAKNWGNSSKNESSILEGIEQADESLHDWFNKEKWVRMDTKGKIKGPCAREPGEGKPKCLPQSKAHSLGKKGRASAAQRKRREDPNPERSGKAINVNTKKN